MNVLSEVAGMFEYRVVTGAETFKHIIDGQYAVNR